MAKPTYSIRCGAVSAALWENPSKTSDGKEFTSQNISLTRTYKKGDSFETTSSLRPIDLMDAAVCLQKTYEYLRCVVSEQEPKF